MATVRLENVATVPARTRHLLASVAVRSPLHAELAGQAAAELFLVHRPGRSAPLVERGGVEGGEGAVGAATQVGHHTMAVQLRVTSREVRCVGRPLLVRSHAFVLPTGGGWLLRR
jgi:hypothetical protein